MLSITRRCTRYQRNVDPCYRPGMARLCEELAAALLAGEMLPDSLLPALTTSLPGMSCLRWDANTLPHLLVW